MCYSPLCMDRSCFAQACKAKQFDPSPNFVNTLRHNSEKEVSDRVGFKQKV